MREVTGEKFFKIIGPLNVTVTPKGDYPYRTDFCYRNGQRVGYTQEIDINGLCVGDRYYLED